MSVRYFYFTSYLSAFIVAPYPFLPLSRSFCSIVRYVLSASLYDTLGPPIYSLDCIHISLQYIVFVLLFNTPCPSRTLKAHSDFSKIVSDITSTRKYWFLVASKHRWLKAATDVYDTGLREDALPCTELNYFARLFRMSPILLILSRPAESFLPLIIIIPA